MTLKKLSYLKALLVVVLVAPVYAGVFQLPFDTSPKPLSEIFSSVLDEKKKLLADLKEEKNELDSTYQEGLDAIETNAQEVKNKIERVQRDLQEKPDDEFLNHKSVRLNELYQVLKETKRTQEKLAVLYEEYIKYIQQYVDDSSFETFKREYRIQDKIQYNFEDLQKMHEYIRAQEKLLLRAIQQEKSVRVELETAERNVIATKISYRKKKEEFQQEVQADNGSAALAYGQKIAMMELEEQYYAARQELNERTIQEIKLRISFINFQAFITYSQLEILKEFRKKIKPAVRISPAGLASAKEERDQKRSAYFKVKNSHGQEIEKVVALEREKEKELHERSALLGVALGRDLDEWSRVPAETVKEYLNLCSVGLLNTQLHGLQRQQEVFESLINFEDEQYAYEDIKVRAREMYFKIILTRQGSEQELNREKKAYETQKANAESAMARYKEKINAVADLLSTQKKILDNISTLRASVEKQRSGIFKSAENEQNTCLNLLLQAERNVRQQVDILSKLTGVYSSTVSSLESTIQVINFILSEFEAVTIWYRPEGAITLRGIKNLFSDVKVFFADMRLYVRKISLFDVFMRIKRLFTMPRAATSFLFTLLFILLSIMLAGWSLASLRTRINEIAHGYQPGFMQMAVFFARTVIDFVIMHFKLLAIWVALYALLTLQPIVTSYGWVFFYVGSIFYWLYIVNQFLKLLMRVNQEEDHIFFAADFQNRFYWVVSFLLYTSIILGLFRQAFVLANYPRSELPAIVLAINFIIFQLSLIFLIAKEQVLNVIPDTNDMWQWIKQQIDKYYYLLILGLIVVIVMSNPYVGYLRLASYILFGLIYSAILILALYWFHGFCKRVASRIFFQEREDIVRERFSNGKTWFGLAIIVSFTILSFIGLIIMLKIWGWQIHLSDVGKWFDKELGTTTISPSELLKFMTFIMLGVLIAYGLNRYVLDKVFDLLLIDAGVQHTVTSISQYVVVIIAIFLGFQSIGLGQPVGYFMLTLAFSIGFVLKEPISDFIAYFIILVQRPIKIGDYIKVDDQVMGVVRQITARSVILRRKNSTTIIVPNLQIISKPIVNWNYSRSFIAFEDIPVSIDYSADPAAVKKLLHEVLDEHPNILKNPRPIIRLNSFNDSGYLFVVRGFLSSVYTLEQWDISSDIRLAIVKKLRDNNIKIGIPTSIYISRNGHDELSTGFLLGADQPKDRKD